MASYGKVEKTKRVVKDMAKMQKPKAAKGYAAKPMKKASGRGR